VIMLADATKHGRPLYGNVISKYSTLWQDFIHQFDNSTQWTQVCYEAEPSSASLSKRIEMGSTCSYSVQVFLSCSYLETLTF
jgi:hypothetical protein